MSDRTIVVGVDYSDHSVDAVDEALRIAAARDVPVVPVLVLPGGPATGGPDAEEMTSELVTRSKENLVQLIQARARALGIPFGPVEPQVRFGAAADQLIAVAREVGARLVAVGSHGREGISHLLLGSVADEVMRKAPCSVLIARSVHRQSLAAGSTGERSTTSETIGLSGGEGERLAIDDVTAYRRERPTPRAPVSHVDEPVGADATEASEPTVVTGPHIDAGRVVMHVLDAPSGQVFVCAFENEGSVGVEPLEGSWVPAPSSTARARVARIALRAAADERALFNELFEEIARRHGR
jgi:universal stress protein A